MPPTCLPARLVATSDQDAPPLDDFRMPTLGIASLPLISPVPANSCCPVASTPRAAMARLALVSLVPEGAQFVPPSVDFHIPPPALPAKTVLALVGSTARLVIRPL